MTTSSRGSEPSPRTDDHGRRPLPGAGITVPERPFAPPVAHARCVPGPPLPPSEGTPQEDVFPAALLPFGPLACPPFGPLPLPGPSPPPCPGPTGTAAASLGHPAPGEGPAAPAARPAHPRPPDALRVRALVLTALASSGAVAVPEVARGKDDGAALGGARPGGEGHATRRVGPRPAGTPPRGKPGPGRGPVAAPPPA